MHELAGIVANLQKPPQVEHSAETVTVICLRSLLHSLAVKKPPATMPSIFKMGSKSGRKTSADYNAGQSPQNPSIAESSQPTAPSHIRVSSVPIHTRQADSISQNPIPADGKLFRASTTAPVNIAVIKYAFILYHSSCLV